MPPPGGRNHRFKSRGIFSTKFSHGRRAWLKVAAMEWALHIVDPFQREDEDLDFIEDRFEGGANMKLVINFAILKFPIKISLTAMTEQELIAFKTFIDMAVTSALPVVRQRTQDAEEARRAGDSSITRLYKPVPQLFVRQGSEYRNSTRVRSGLDWPAGLEFPAEVLTDEFRGDGSDVPERDPYLDSPEDYVQATHDLPVVRPLGWAPVGPDGLFCPAPKEGESTSTPRWNRRRTPNGSLGPNQRDEGAPHAVELDGDEDQ